VFVSVKPTAWNVVIGEPRFYFVGGKGGGADREAIYNLCLILKTVMNIMSKSSSRHLVRLQVKLKPTEKEEKMCVYIHRFFSMFFHVPVYLSSVDFTG